MPQSSSQEIGSDDVRTIKPLHHHHHHVYRLRLPPKLSCIFLFILDSIFLQTIVLQGDPLFGTAWPIGWVTGAMANKNGLQTCQDPEPSYAAHIEQENSKDNVDGENHRCSSSFHHSFFQSFILVCLPRSNGRWKYTTHGSRNKVPIRKSCLQAECSGSKDMDLRNKLNDPMGQVNESDCVMIVDSESVDPSMSLNEISEKLSSAKHQQDETRFIFERTENDNVEVHYSDSETDAAESILNESPALTSKLSSVQVRQEPGDGLYNYASESKGAQVLDSNKDAKGASNILNADRDKYLRIPCSSDDKFVDLELSEETLVISIAVANHEFYSSNLRQFELWGSLVYPPEEWRCLGRFNADNIRTLQKFNLIEPSWVRYLRMKMLTHYGSDFYCTLSTLEVYGVDAIEWLLEDWIAEETSAVVKIPQPQGETASKLNHLIHKAISGEPPLQKGRNTLDMDEPKPQDNGDRSLEAEDKAENYKFKDIKKPEVRSAYHQTGRPALDAVMKLLMQKVRSLEQNQPRISHYIQELSNRYKENINILNQDLGLMSDKLDYAAAELHNLKSSLHNMETNRMHENQLLQNELVNQLKKWNGDMDIVRSRLDEAERKGMVALGIVFLSGTGVITVQILAFFLHLLKMIHRRNIGNPYIWLVPFFGLVMVMLVITL